MGGNSQRAKEGPSVPCAPTAKVGTYIACKLAWKGVVTLQIDQ